MTSAQPPAIRKKRSQRPRHDLVAQRRKVRIFAKIELVRVGTCAEHWQQIQLRQSGTIYRGRDLRLWPIPVDFALVEPEVVHAPVASLRIKLAHVRNHQYDGWGAHTGGGGLDLREVFAE